MKRFTRRGAILGLGAAAIGGGCVARSVTGIDDADTAPPANPKPKSVRLSDTLAVHLVQTGWVSVKRPHRAFKGADGLALPAIVASASWTPWLPVTATVVEHATGTIVVDTGETARIADPEHTRCDAVTGWFYGANLRFLVREEDEIGPQLRTLDIDPDGIGTVVMTHLHSDHIGGMPHFPNASFLVSRADAGGHAGALMCRIPADVKRVSVEHDGPAVDAFAGSHAVTKDRSVLIVPTPGHTKGHQSVLLREGDRSWLIAGDAVFDRAQIESGTIAGIAEDRAAARATVATLRDQMDRFGTIVLPSHDPESAARLTAG